MVVSQLMLDTANNKQGSFEAAKDPVDVVRDTAENPPISNTMDMAGGSTVEASQTTDEGEKQFMVRTQEVMLPNQQMATVIDLGNCLKKYNIQ